jgi:hypothetical protein
MGNLITLSELKVRLNITDDDNDRLLINLISDVSGIIENYCGRHFTAADYTEYHDGNDEDEFNTDEWPINSIASIYDDPDRTFPSSTLVDADDYTFYANEGRVALLISGTIIGRNFRTVFSYGRNNIKITYNAGYTTIPSDLKSIASEVIARKYKNVMDKRWGLIGVGSAGENMTFSPDDLSAEHRRLLDSKYRGRGTE